MTWLLKDPLSTVASKLGLWRLGSRLIPAMRGRRLLSVFTFHRISANPNDARYLARYDRGTSGMQFRYQLEAIQQNYNILSLQEFCSHLTDQPPPARHSALLTFDDADSEFYNVAFPVLKLQRLPAVVFAPTAYVGSDRVFWHLKISNSLNHISEEEWEVAKRSLPLPRGLENSKLLSASIRSPEERMNACQRLIWLLDEVDESEAIAAADALQELIGCPYTLGINSMSWDQLSDIEAGGIAVESHCVNHRKLTQLPADQMSSELIDSKLTIENRLKKSVRAICYPGGYFNPQVIKAASECGYRLGFTTQAGFCQHSSPGFRDLTIPRFNMQGISRAAAERFLTGIVLKH